MFNSHIKKYILCYYSTIFLLCLSYEISYFNTSHVIIQPKPPSYININLNNFNTSHVIIQQRKIILKKSEEQISIHPMLLFN